MSSKIKMPATRPVNSVVYGLFGAFFAAAILVSSLTHDADAADGSGKFRVFGSGELTCQRWVSDRFEGNASSVQSEMWVAGYLTAYNQFVFKGADIAKRFDGAAMLSWLDEYCQKRPPNTLITAAKELIQMLHRHR